MSTLRDIKIIEAILFASGEPVSEEDLKDKIVKKSEFNNSVEAVIKLWEAASKIDPSLNN